MNKIGVLGFFVFALSQATELLWSGDVNSLKSSQRQHRNQELRYRGRSQAPKSSDLKYSYKGFYRRIDPRLGRTIEQDRSIAWLFTMGWKSIEALKFDIAADAFSKLIVRGALLSDQERASAFLGRAIANYNQKGCNFINSDLIEADRHRSISTEVSFYRGMCFLEKERFVEAEALFERVVETGSGALEESALFYRAISWELTHQLDRAQEGYLDVINNAQDKSLVARAKQRLETIQLDLRKFFNERQWWSLLLSANVGYDTNAISLPEELKAIDYGYSKDDTGYYQGLLFAEVRPAWSQRFRQQLRYTLFVQHYDEYLISKSLDVASHEIQSANDWSLGNFNKIGTQFAYNSISVGDLAEHKEYMGIPSVKLFYKKVGTFGYLKKINKEPAYEGAEESTQATLYAKLAALRPKQRSVLEDYNATALVYTLGYDQNYFESDYMNWGHKLLLEYKKASGKENVYYSAAGTLNYSYLLAWTTKGVTLAHDLALQYYQYDKSSTNRRDYVLRSNLSFSHEVWDNAEMQWLFSITANLSTEKATYQYLKTLGQLGVTQYF